MLVATGAVASWTTPAHCASHPANHYDRLRVAHIWHHWYNHSQDGTIAQAPWHMRTQTPSATSNCLSRRAVCSRLPAVEINGSTAGTAVQFNQVGLAWTRSTAPAADKQAQGT